MQRQEGDLIQERYRLVALLGRGGMAEVWRALDERLERPVAVKLLAPHLAEDPDFLFRFFSEAQSVARISHPSVVKVLDFGQHDELPYLVMELVPGGAVPRPGGEPLVPARAFQIVAQAARGAGAAHAHGLVHRDIKPGNILLDDDGNAKLADFGVASSRTAEHITVTGTAIGSPFYISPEQVSGAPATPHSDVYSLGVVLYELLAGQRPFDGDNPTLVAISHVDKDPQPPSAHNPALGPAVDGVVLRCLSKDPEDRFPHGDALAEVLEATAKGEELTPAAAARHPQGEEDDDEEFDIRPPRLVPAVLVALVFVGLLLMAYYWRDRVADGPPAEPKVATTAPPAAEAKRPRPRPAPTKAPTSEQVMVPAADTSPRPSPSPSRKPRKRTSGAVSREPQAPKAPAPPPAVPSPEPSAQPSPEPSPEPEPSPTVGTETGTEDGTDGSDPGEGAGRTGAGGTGAGAGATGGPEEVAPEAH